MDAASPVGPTRTILSPVTPAEHKRQQGSVRAVSVLPEGVCVNVRLNFVIIGANAREILKTLSEAELHIEVSAKLSAAYRGGSTMSQQATAQTSMPRPGLDLTIHGDEAGIMCMLDRHEQKVARITFATVERFSDTLPALASEAEVRNSCFLFLCDWTPENLEDTLSILNQGLAELTHSYDRVQKKHVSARRTPALRAVMLVHDTEGRNHCSIPENACMEDKAPACLGAFAEKLHDATKGSPISGMRAANFRSSDSLYERIEELAREMHETIETTDTTRSSAAPSESLSRGTEGSSGSCCTAQ